MALTFERSAAPSWGNPSRAALARLTDDDVGVERLDTGEDGWIAFAGADEYDSLGPPSGAFSVVLGRLSRTREAELTTAELTTALSDDALTTNTVESCARWGSRRRRSSVAFSFGPRSTVARSSSA